MDKWKAYKIWKVEHHNYNLLRLGNEVETKLITAPLPFKVRSRRGAFMIKFYLKEEELQQKDTFVQILESLRGIPNHFYAIKEWGHMQSNSNGNETYVCTQKVFMDLSEHIERDQYDPITEDVKNAIDEWIYLEKRHKKLQVYLCAPPEL